MPSTTKRHLLLHPQFFIGLGVAALVVVFVARALGPLSDLKEAAGELRSRWLWPALGTALASLLLAGLRMRWSLQLGGDKVADPRCLLAVLSAWPVAVISPARTGDFFRAAALRNDVLCTIAPGSGAASLEPAREQR